MGPTPDPTRPAEPPGRDSVVTLREITRDTVREIVRLKVAPEQERFVATNGMSIAEAHYSQEVAWFRAIYADGHPVGFAMLEDEPDKQRYFLWRFMIDARYQGMGFGRRALELVIAHVRTRPGATSFGTSCVPGEGGPQPFYEGLGFVDTGVEDDGERILRLDL